MDSKIGDNQDCGNTDAHLPGISFQLVDSSPGDNERHHRHYVNTNELLNDTFTPKPYQRDFRFDRPMTNTIFCCCGVIPNCMYCCWLSVKDTCRVCCCRCIIGPKRPSWNRNFDFGVSIIGNILHNVYPHKKSVNLIRYIDGEIYSWLPCFPTGVTCVPGKRRDEFIASNGHEWVFPSHEGYPNFTDAWTKDRKFIIFIPGGAFMFNGPHSHRYLCAEICKASGATILVLNTRRAPEYPYPIPNNDCYNAYLWLLGKVSASRVVLAGDSAGGSLVVSTIVRARAEGIALPKGAILLSPWVDFFDNSYESCKLFESVDYISSSMIPFAGQMFSDPPNPGLSPMFQNLHNFPPLLVEIGDAEILRDSILRFVRKAQKCGVDIEYNIYTDMVHVFQMLAALKQDQAIQSFKNIGLFIDRLFVKDEHISRQSSVFSSNSDYNRAGFVHHHSIQHA